MISYNIIFEGEQDIEILANSIKDNSMIAVFQSKDILTMDQLIAQTKKRFSKGKVIYITHKDYNFKFDNKTFIFHLDDKYFNDIKTNFWYAILFELDDSDHYYKMIIRDGCLTLIRM